MANTKNLKRGNPETQFRAGREQVETARKGGKRSGEVRRERADIKRLLESWLNDEHNAKQSGKVTGSQAIVNQIVATALNPDSKYWGKAIDTILQLSGALITDEQRERQQAKLRLINAKADKMTNTDNTTLEKLDSILDEMLKAAES